MLRHDYWHIQNALVSSVFRRNSRTAIKACHASSKTYTAADIVVMALMLGGDVLTTAPTGDQVKGQLWQQVRYVASGQPECADWNILNTEVHTSLGGPFAIGRSTDQGVRLQGYHARPDSFLLIIADEAPGVIPDIYDAMSGISAGGDVRILLLGNPVIPSGPFFEIFEGDVPGWSLLTVDAFDTPNLQGLTLEELLELPDHELDDNVRPYLVTRRWVRDRFYEWGVDNAQWQSRVRGEFPQNADVSLIWRSWLDDARGKDAADNPEDGPIVAGVDVAGPGEDETVLVVRRAGSILSMETFSIPDPRGAVLAALRGWLHRGLLRVSVDTAGIGYYFSQHIRDGLPEGVDVQDVNVGESATSDQAKEKYLNLRAELYWALRERFQDGDVRGLTDPTAISQLASLQYHHDARGRVVIEKKEDARKRGVKSPDRAEALMLAFAPESHDQMLARALAKTTRAPTQTGIPSDRFLQVTQGRTGRGARPWGVR